MKISFDKFTYKSDWIIAIIPTIAFGKDENTWFLGFAWLCFVINVNF